MAEFLFGLSMGICLSVFFYFANRAMTVSQRRTDEILRGLREPTWVIPAHPVTKEQPK